MYNYIDKRSRFGQTYEERYINKFHSLVKDNIAAEIDKFNFQIRFIEPTWVIKEYYGGFVGGVDRRELVQLKDIPFGVLSVDRDKKKQCSTIHVWTDGLCDGYRCRLINVPNGVFKELC